MTHMIIGDIESVEMTVKEGGSIVSMEPSSVIPAVEMSAPTPVVARIERDYDRLNNRPSINEHLLHGGENTLDEIGIARATSADIARLFS